MRATVLHCTILGTIAAFWIKLLATPSPRLHFMPITHTHTHTYTPQHANTYSLISSHPLSSCNPRLKPFLSMRTPQPVGPCQGKLGQGGGFCFAPLSEKQKKKKKIQIISWAGAIWHAVITALTETSLTSLKEKTFCIKTRTIVVCGGVGAY